MTRKDYVAMAAALNAEWHRWPDSGMTGPCVREALGRIAHDFAAIARKDNPRFDTGRFLEACWK